MKLEYDKAEGLGTAPEKQPAEPLPKDFTRQQMIDSACHALEYSLELGNLGNCALDQRCASIYISAITNYHDFQEDLKESALRVAKNSKSANEQTKVSFNSFVANPTHSALSTLPDVELQPSRLRLSLLIPSDCVIDVTRMADLKRCADYVESCVVMALDVEKSPLSCKGWKQLKPALIQIADDNHVFLLHSDFLCSSEAITIANRIFAALLGHRRTLVVFGDDDMKMIRELDFLTLPHPQLCNLVDMKKMCPKSPSLKAQAGEKCGLGDWVAAKWRGHVLSKSWTMSGWDMPGPLLEAQLEYAALDAAVTFALWKHCSVELVASDGA